MIISRGGVIFGGAKVYFLQDAILCCFYIFVLVSIIFTFGKNKGKFIFSLKK
jgi:hypothetical protein